MIGVRTMARGIGGRLSVRRISYAELDGALGRAFERCLVSSLARSVWPRGIRQAALVAYRKAHFSSGQPERPQLWALCSGQRLAAVAVWEMLHWDSAQYGMPMARMSLVISDADTRRQCRLTNALLATVLPFSDGRGIRHLAVRVDHQEYGAAVALGARGFRFVDASVTLSTVPDGRPAAPAGIRATEPRDVAALQMLAVDALSFGRAYHDPRLPVAHNRALVRNWIANNCRGRSQQVFVAARGRSVRGFICCNLDGASGPLLGRRIGYIDLMAVAASHQGRGIGRALMTAALRWFSTRTDLVEIRTQVDNRVALALYQNAGFSIRSNGLALLSGYTFHRWSDDA